MLPSLIDSHNELFQEENYQQRLHDIAANKSKFSEVKGIVSGRSFL